jgi:hypothetical protein
VDRDKQGLENLLDRSDADVRGLKRVSMNFSKIIIVLSFVDRI